MPVIHPTTGKTVYGRGRVAIDGAVPAALSARDAGGAFWLSTVLVFLQDYTTAPQVGKTYNINTTAIATVDPGPPNGANFTGAGNSVWAVWLAGSGVRTSTPPNLSLPQASLIEVSEAGLTAVVVNSATASGIRIYSAAGAVLLTIPTVLSASPYAFCRYGHVSYEDKNGWHLTDASSGRELTGFQQRQNILSSIPVRVGTTMWALEYETTTSELQIRNVVTGHGWIVNTAPVAGSPTLFFNPDARPHPSTADTMRLAWCTGAGEDASELVVLDVNLLTGATIRWTVVAGVLVSATGPTLTAASFPGSSAGRQFIPYSHPVVEDKGHRRERMITDPWYKWAQGITFGLANLTSSFNSLPSMSAPGFGQVTAPSQPTAQASAPNDVLTFEVSGGLSVTIDAAQKKVLLDGGGAGVTDAEYLVGALHAGLTNERLVVDTSTVTWDLSTPGEAKANAIASALGGHLHGMQRFLGDGATDTFNLLDLAEYLEHVGVDGAFEDPATFSLSADRSQIVFDTPPGAGVVVTIEYVMATL